MKCWENIVKACENFKKFVQSKWKLVNNFFYKISSKIKKFYVISFSLQKKIEKICWNFE